MTKQILTHLPTSTKSELIVKQYRIIFFKDPKNCEWFCHAVLCATMYCSKPTIIRSSLARQSGWTNITVVLLKNHEHRVRDAFPRSELQYSKTGVYHHVQFINLFDTHTTFLFNSLVYISHSEHLVGNQVKIFSSLALTVWV